MTEARHALISGWFGQFGHKTEGKSHFKERARRFGGLVLKTTLRGGFPGLSLKTEARIGGAKRPGWRTHGGITRLMSRQSKGNEGACPSNEKDLVFTV